MRVAHPTGPTTGIDGTLANFEVLADGTVAAVADARPPPRRSCATCGSTTLGALYARVTVPVLLVPADHGGDGAGMVAKRRGGRRGARAGCPTRGCTGSGRRPTTTSTRSTRTSSPPCCWRWPRRARREPCPGCSRSWARARPRRRWSRSTARCSSGSAPVRRCCSTRRTASRRTPTTSPSKAAGVLPRRASATPSTWRRCRSRRRRRAGRATRPSAGSRRRATCSPGPGSPTYALRQWARHRRAGAARREAATGAAPSPSPAPPPSRSGVRDGARVRDLQGGRDPRWLDGLDLLGAATGLRAAVIPHYDNAEGGHHDTRFCYLGERRLGRAGARAARRRVRARRRRAHRRCVLDLDAGRASVRRPRRRDRAPPAAARRSSRPAPTLAIDDLRVGRARAGPRASVGDSRRAGAASRPTAGAAAGGVTPLMAEAHRLEAAFDAALAARRRRRRGQRRPRARPDARRLVAPTRRSPTSPTACGPTLRSMIVRLGEVAALGLRDPRRGRSARSSRRSSTARAAARAAEDWPAGRRAPRRAGRRRRRGAGHADGQTWLDVDRACRAEPPGARRLAGGRVGPASVLCALPAGAVRHVPPPSSSGLGHHPFKVAARVRIPLGVRRQQGPVVQFGVHAGLSSRRSRVQIPSGPPSPPPAAAEVG